MDTKFSTATLFTLYTSLTAIVTLFQQFYYQFVPELIRDYIASKIKLWFDQKPSTSESFTLVINEHGHDSWNNHLYDACGVYISSKLRSKASRLTGSHDNPGEPISYRITLGEKFVETFEKDGITITLFWKFVSRNHEGEEDNSGTKKSFELSFDNEYKNEVLDFHLPLVVVKFYEDMKDKKKDIFLYTLDGEESEWRSIQFNHPFTFDALALDPKLKRVVIDDLDMFIMRKEFYKRVGRAWKRGYLLYGPPGTGKSSLVAAMANYLKFDIYDLQLGGVRDDATLRRLMLSTTNKSILVIEDIDCTFGLSRNYSEDYDRDENESGESDEKKGSQEAQKGNFEIDTLMSKLSLSGLLNFIDGLWSSCGDERIIVFTTNEKEKLDKALLRPGRMDMHVHMSYLTMPGFKVLAENYLGVTGEHALFDEIEPLIETANVTPAQVAEELIRSEDVDVALSSVVEMLKTRLDEIRKKKANEKNKVLKTNKDLAADEKSIE